MTTPQDIALLDARRGAEMFRSVQVPVSWDKHSCLEYIYTCTIISENIPRWKKQSTTYI